MRPLSDRNYGGRTPYTGTSLAAPRAVSNTPKNFLDYFFNGWPELGRTILIAVLAYAALILLLRISGKRTLSKLNAFDLIVTVAFGSTLASVIMSKDVALAEGVLAFALLIALQFVITWLSVHFKPFSKLVKAEPRLLFCDGDFIESALQSERLTRGEVRAAARGSGVASMQQVHAIVLETDGSLSVIKPNGASDNSALEGVKGWSERS